MVFRLLPEGLWRCVRDCKAPIAIVKTGTLDVPQCNASWAMGMAAAHGLGAVQRTRCLQCRGCPRCAALLFLLLHLLACSQQGWGEFAWKQSRSNKRLRITESQNVRGWKGPLWVI